MLFSRIVSFFVLSLTLGGVSLASPVAQQPDLAAVQNVVTNLKASTDVIVPELRNLVANKNVTAASVTPLMNQLISAINTARQSVNNVPRSVSTTIEKRQSPDDISAALAEIITEIATLLNSLTGLLGDVPVLGILIPELDIALTTLVAGLAGVVSGLVTAGLLAYLPCPASSVASGWASCLASLALQDFEGTVSRRSCYSCSDCMDY